MHYLNDILCLSIKALNEVLVDHLLQRLLIPLYVFSLTRRSQLEELLHSSSLFDSDERAAMMGRGAMSGVLSATRPRVDPVVSLFLLSQVFLIISHVPLAKALARIIFNGNMAIFFPDPSQRPGSPNFEPKVKLK
jgi:protein CLEC16A